MTDMEVSLATKLSAIARVYPLQLPEQPLYPAIVYQRISTATINRTHNGQKKVRPRFQFAIYAKTYESCRITADAIETSLDGKSDGSLGIELATYENRFDIKEVDTGLFRVNLEYFIWQN